MPTPSALEICRTDLFTKEAKLQERYPQVVVDNVLRIREMYNWFIANPDGTDAFDTLYIGCEKFPYHNAISVNVSGVL